MRDAIEIWANFCIYEVGTYFGLGLPHPVVNLLQNRDICVKAAVKDSS